MRIHLAGIWELSLGNNCYKTDSNIEAFHPTLKGEGEHERIKEDLEFDIHLISFQDQIELPSTTEISKKGTPLLDEKQKLHLNRNYPFTGKCYYKKSIEIPKALEGKKLRLVLERTKFTRIFWEGQEISSSHETLIPQVHFLPEKIKEGTYELIIEVDNDLKSYKDFPESLYSGHQYTDHTQTNWNGILGEIYIEEEKNLDFKRICVRKGKTWQDIIFEGTLIYHNISQEVTLGVEIEEEYFEHKLDCKTGENSFRFHLKKKVLLKGWDEFEPHLYKVNLLAKDEEGNEVSKILKVGFYELKSEHKRLILNEKLLSLRGNIDCAIFPKTGAAPMSKGYWQKLLGLLKVYGMNHCRFHSWCPPEGAFEAADELGIYLQIELSCFANGLYEEGNEKCDKVLNNYLYDQAQKVILQYGNHPSFLFFALGNEMIGDLAAFDKLIRQLKAVRPDKLYSQGANNFLEDPVCALEDEFWIVMRTTKDGNNIRGSFSHGDLPLGHLQTKEVIGTLKDYKEALEHSHLPLIAHEVGQYETFPDFRELESQEGLVTYHMPLKRSKEILASKNMLNQAQAFFEASGKLAMQCYKEDIEAILRTEGMSGFQLLSLQDYPGQGMAMIGVLNSLWQSKGLITPKEWREFCSEHVILAKMPAYTYEAGKPIKIGVSFYNYGKTAVEEEDLIVSLEQGEKLLKEVCISHITAPRGRVSDLAEVYFETQDIKGPMQCELVLKLAGVTNHYPLWIYEKAEVQVSAQVYVTKQIDEKTECYLQEGKSVVLLSDQVKPHIEAGFTTDFWCYPMFKSACETKNLKVAPGTMGLLIDNKHPALALFPTDFYASWQWQQIVVHAKPTILDDREEENMIVQVIDNFERCHKLGLIYEKKVGKGKLITCTVDLLSYMHIPEMKQLYNSLISYANESI